MKPSNYSGHPISRSISGWVGTGLVGSTLMLVSPAAAANTLSAWQFDPATQQFTVTLPQGVTPYLVETAEPGQIVLRIPQTQVGNVEVEGLYDGPVHRVSLSQLGGDTQVVLELAPGMVLAPDQAQLTAMAAGDQTRWVLTPLIAEAGRVAMAPGTDPATPGASGMVVELPVIPAAGAEFTFPEEGQGRLSTTASNLMLPSDVENLENLPETLPIDPFNVGLAENEQVTVPALDELDATVGPVATVPQGTVPPGESLPLAASEAVANPTESPQVNPETVPAITVSPPDVSVATEASGNGAAAPVASSLPDLSEEPSTPAEPEEQGVALEVVPASPISEMESAELATVPVAPLPEEPMAELATVPVESVPEAPTADGSTAAVAGEPVAGAEPPVLEPGPQEQVALNPITVSPPAVAEAVVAGTVSPQDGTQTGSAIPETTLPTEPLLSAQDNDPVLRTAPPLPGEVALEPVPSEDVLTVPVMPDTTSTAAVTPPTTTFPREFMVAAAEPINFGQPLPGTGDKTVDPIPEGDTVAPNNRRVPPDILIAAGTVLELRYPGNQPLVLEAGTNLKEVLLLETDILDPITQGVIAPRGSQLIGQFQPGGTNQQWVSEMIIVPTGQRVPLASTSEYLVGTPQVDGGRLAVGAGAGALALALLTSFSGVGLIGGAIVGATAMVGTSPQQVVIEPNQIIAVQVTENVPRSMPIAAGPDLSREWGVE